MKIKQGKLFQLYSRYQKKLYQNEFKNVTFSTCNCIQKTWSLTALCNTWKNDECQWGWLFFLLHGSAKWTVYILAQ